MKLPKPESASRWLQSSLDGKLALGQPTNRSVLKLNSRTQIECGFFHGEFALTHASIFPYEQLIH